jgi:glycosyltransferase involved in cell wall biosynthesis
VTELRILWVKLGGLWPPTAGGRIRSFEMVRAMSELHPVSVLTTHGPGAPAPDLAARLPRAERVSSFPHAPPKRSSARFAVTLGRSWLSPLPVELWRWRVPTLARAAEAALSAGDYDVCIADFLAAIPNLPARPQVPVLLFEHNVEHLIWRRLGAGVAAWQRPLVAVEWRKLRRYEARACRRANVTVAVSEPDRALLGSIAPGAAIRTIPTGVDLDYFGLDGGRQRERELSVAFVGSMDWYPNEDAALHLIDAILPLVRRELPQTTATIIGREPSARLRAAAARAGVRLTGTVPDVRPYLAEAAVIAVPIRIGGGTRLKIFEALAMGKAVVSSTVGAEGLPVVPGEHLLAADEPSAFASAVVGLLRDPARRRRLGQAGRELVAERHSWSEVTQVFEAHCREAASGALGGRPPKRI